MMGKDYNDKSGLAYYWLEANMGLVLIALLFACVGLWGLLLEDMAELDIGRRLVKGMGPELAGIVIAAVTVNALAERRQEVERKKILISQLGSQYRDVTELALIELRNRGWLYDGSLRGADLRRADLSNAKLSLANLSKANFEWADLSGASLAKANLSDAHLALPYQLVISGEVFQTGTTLEGADLSMVFNWTIEQLEQAKTLEGATMPDEIQLELEETEYQELIDGPTFEEWKAQYLAEHGGTIGDLRDIS